MSHHIKKNFSKVTVLYNEVESLPFEDEQAMLTVVEAKDDAKTIANALARSGYDADIFKLDENSLNDLKNIETDLFFNVCDGIGSQPKTEPKVPELLDEWNLPYSGGDALSINLTTNKAMTKQVFIQNSLPTPNYAIFIHAPKRLPGNLKFPLFVKPIAEDCSLGVNHKSVVFDLPGLGEAIENIVKSYKEPAIVEEYIDGREINATVVGNGGDAKVLPLSEIVFGKFYDDNGLAKFVDFDAKWLEDSTYFKETKGLCPAPLSPELTEKINVLAKSAYLVCGGRDYARVDMRLDKNNNPYLLEVNVNPAINPSDGAPRSARRFGWNYHEFIGAIASFAAARYMS